jgi:sulfatase modifying factor 1
MSQGLPESLSAEVARVRRDFADLRAELAQVRALPSAPTRRRGVFTSAGVVAESLLKVVYRREGRETGGRPAAGLTLEELTVALKDALPEHIKAPLRTVQDFRNKLGAHDNGDLSRVNPLALETVDTALAQVVLWFLSACGADVDPGADGDSRPPATAAAALDAADAPDPLDAWRERYWWGMRGGGLKLLDVKALKNLALKGGLTDGQRASVEAAFRRDLAAFDEVLSQALEDAHFGVCEVEALEQARLDACISAREATAHAIQRLRQVAALPAASPPWLVEAHAIARACAEDLDVADAGGEDAVDATALPAPVRPAWARPWMDEAGEDAFGRCALVCVAGVPVRLRYCAPGRFKMGSPVSEADRYDDETQHRVELTRGLWLGEVPVTQALWEAVTGANPSHFKGLDRPVESVSWEACEAFLARANHLRPGLAWRLPTEAEWEYACRAGTSGPRYGPLAEIAWHDRNAGRETHPVGLLAPNLWGLRDMLGQVWEWVADWHGEYPSGPVCDPRGPSHGVTRVRRGGGWDNFAGTLRAALRGSYSPAGSSSYLGLRVARTDL